MKLGGRDVDDRTVVETEYGRDLSLVCLAFPQLRRLANGVAFTRELRLAPNFEWVFPDNATYFSLSLDLHYEFRTKGRVKPWLGGGLGIYSVNPEGPGGTGRGRQLHRAGHSLKGELMPYIQLKLVVKGDTETVLAFGLRF